MPLASTVRYPREGVALAALEGRLEYGPALQQLKIELIPLAEKPSSTLIIDLTKVQYTDGAGLGMLLFLNGAAHDVGSAVRLAGSGPRLLQIFQITHTAPLFVLDPDIETSLSRAPQ